MSARVPQEFAPGVYRLLVGQGALRANVYFVRAEPQAGSKAGAEAGPGTRAADGNPTSAATCAATRADWTLVDTGVPGCDIEIREAADVLFGPGARPTAILVTHAHPDHVGSAAALARYWECPVYLHPEEVRMIGGDAEHFRRHSFTLDRWLILPLLRLGGRRHIRSLMQRDGLREFAIALQHAGAATGATSGVHLRDVAFPVPGLRGWEALPTPGHTPGHIVLFRAEDGVLLSGDAVVTKAGPLASLPGGRSPLSRAPWYFTWNRGKAGRSLLMLAALDPAVIAGGHGAPLRDTGLAGRLRALATKP